MGQWGCSNLADLSLFVTATTVTFSKVKSELNFVALFLCLFVKQIKKQELIDRDNS